MRGGATRRAPATSRVLAPLWPPAALWALCLRKHPSRPYPPAAGILRGQAMLQALPCIVAAHALDPQPGWNVLDM